LIKEKIIKLFGEIFENCKKVKDYNEDFVKIAESLIKIIKYSIKYIKIGYNRYSKV